MTLTRWNPTTELTTMRRLMDRMLGDDFLQPFTDWNGGATAAIPLDVADQGETLLVKASVPGIPAEDIQVEVQDNILTISGEMKQDSESKEQSWFVQEHRYGRFERRLRLPVPVESGQVQATLKNGILTLSLPKSSAAATNRIPVLTA